MSKCKIGKARKLILFILVFITTNILLFYLVKQIIKGLNQPMWLKVISAFFVALTGLYIAYLEGEYGMTRKEKLKTYYDEILDSVENDYVEWQYNAVIYCYKKSCEDIIKIKNKLSKLKKPKGIRYHRLMEKLDTRVLQRNIYKGYLNNWKIMGAEEHDI